MKITMNLPVEPAVFFKQLQLSALADIRTHTGREPLPGSLRGFSSMLIHWQRRKTTFALAIA